MRLEMSDSSRYFNFLNPVALGQRHDIESIYMIIKVAIVRSAFHSSRHQLRGTEFEDLHPDALPSAVNFK